MQLWQIRGCTRILRKDPTTELAAAINGHGLSIGQLLYAIFDQLQGANWQRTGKKTGKPKPLEQLLEDAATADRRADEAQRFDEIYQYLNQFDPANRPAVAEEDTMTEE